ncbi:MAG: hypothetical protein NC308_03315 [Clostridium sp.]|nr:hypothetical protein [Bacteroides sp.]MCM1197895.1 hypothetical protein [Clostridium sp.]
MNRLSIISVTVFMLCLAVQGAAQERALTYGRAIRNNLWNDGSNIAGIRQDSVTISNAEIGAMYESGDFRQTWQPEEKWSAGAMARTMVHLKRFSMAGSFSFAHSENYGACGSMMVHPGFYPVDIMEFTPGRKTLQKYSFDGGISYDIGSHWRIGGKIDFTSYNYSKRKDLRYTDYCLDMEVSPGIMWHSGDFAVGLNYLYARNYETIKAEQIGTKASSYYAFLDKGLMYGAYEVWESDGVHLAESGINSFPVKENIHGVALQTQYRGIFAEVSYRHSAGSIGEKQSIWFNFPGNEVSVKAGWQFGHAVRHSLRLGFDWKRQFNDENVMEKVTSGGVTTTNIYASNRIYERTGCAVSPEYELVAGRWELLAGAEASFDGQVSAQKYPYLYVRNTAEYSVHADALVHLWRFDLGAGVSFSGGTWNEDSRTVDTGVQASGPYRYEEYFLLQKEYMTADVIGARLKLRYNILHGLYVEASGGVQHAFGIEHLAGTDRWRAGFGIGYTF